MKISIRLQRSFLLDAMAETEDGIVTTYTEWLFFRCLDERIQRHEASIFRNDNIPTQETVKEIAEPCCQKTTSRLNEWSIELQLHLIGFQTGFKFHT